MDKLRACVMGWPVSHSLSPKLHGYWLKYYAIEGVYTAREVLPEVLGTALRELHKNGWRGSNLTIPHKEAALGYVDHLDDAAKAIGAVNTVVVHDGKLYGSNSDAYGFTENIRAYLPERTKKAVILGAGGAAKAVCYALLQLGFTDIHISNRSLPRAKEIARQFGGVVTCVPWEKRKSALMDADLLVNATSLGMTGKEALILDLDPLPKHALVTDIVYAPLMTPLLETAKARGNPVVDGLGMLLHQAVPGFEAWFGVRPEVTRALRNAVLGL